jgi:3'(2'), 5'-bisphosphate nucleotidase
MSLLYTAIVASIEAGKKIVEIYNNGNFETEMKSDNSPLTLADKASHEVIKNLLSKTGIPVLSEEGKMFEYELRKLWKRYWLVDPLDGTKEFINKNGEFTVNIALINYGNPIIGVIYVPVTGELYFANLNGSFKKIVFNSEEINPNDLTENASILPLTTSNDEYVVVGSRSHMNDETREYIDKLDKQGKPLKMITKGSSLKLCIVAEGNADIYPRLGPTMEWDTAAGHAIALFAGRKVTIYPSGGSLKYSKEDLHNPWFIVK